MTQQVSRRPRAVPFRTPPKKYELTDRGAAQVGRSIPLGTSRGSVAFRIHIILRTINKSASGRLTATGILRAAGGTRAFTNRAISQAVIQGLIV